MSLYKITKEINEELKKPWGIPFTEKEIANLNKSEKSIITVGDMVSTTFLKNGVTPALMIFDYKTERSSYNEMDKYLAMLNSSMPCVVNPAGYITQDLISEIGMALARIQMNRSHFQIMVLGEEDLAAVVALSKSPIGTVVIYGVPGVGMNIIEVTQEMKDKMKTLIKRCEKV